MKISREQILIRRDLISDILRDEIYNAQNDRVLDGLQTQFQFSDDVKFLIEEKMQYVFLGFLRIKDLFEELVQEVHLDSKTALTVFQALDQKIFANHRAEIEENYRQFQAGSPVGDEEVEPLKTQEQVLLRKESSPETVDLSLKDIPIETQNSKLKTQNDNNEENSKQQTDINTVNLSPHFSGPAPVSVGSEVSIKPATNQTAQSPLITNHSPLPTSNSSGPVVIHKVEEAQSVGQINAVKGYKQMSFGSFMGSFGTPQGKATNVSRAEVEIPGAPKPQFASTPPQGTPVSSATQQVPFSVKKYETSPPPPQPNEQAKVVHYTFDGDRQR